MEKLSFLEFQNEVQNRILDYIQLDYPKKTYQVIVQEFDKLNNETLVGLFITNSLEKVAPRLVLNGYYLEHTLGHSLEYCLTSIGYDYRQAMQASPKVKAEDLMIYDAVKDSLEVQLINKNENKRWLLNYPHRDFEDLSMIYLVRVSDNSIIKINNELMNIYGLTEEELHNTAMQCSMKNLPMDVQSMTSMIKELMADSFDMASMGNLVSDIEEIDKTIAALFPDGQDMYIISNSEKVNGAAALFYPGNIEKIAFLAKGSYYVLPSSIHETIMIPAIDGNYEALNQMVKDININEIPQDIFLSNNTYCFDAVTHEFGYAKNIIEKHKDSIITELKSAKISPNKQLVEKMLKYDLMTNQRNKVTDVMKAAANPNEVPFQNLACDLLKDFTRQTDRER